MHAETLKVLTNRIIKKSSLEGRVPVERAVTLLRNNPLLVWWEAFSEINPGDRGYRLGLMAIVLVLEAAKISTGAPSGTFWHSNPNNLIHAETDKKTLPLLEIGWKRRQPLYSNSLHELKRGSKYGCRWGGVVRKW